jgi:hypothetical protein
VGGIAVAIFLASAGPAVANTKTISDPNDRPGPLDIRSASHGHAGARVTHRISTFGTWPIGLLRPSTPNLFAVEISTDSDPALERVVLISSRNGRMIADVFTLPSGDFVGSASASKPNARTLRVSILRSRLGNPAGYRWNAFSQFKAAGACSSFCFDRAPNRGRVLHDITPPVIVLTSFPQVPEDVTYNVSFRVTDRGGSGLRRWTLQRRLFGSSAWTTIRTGTAGGLRTVAVNSVENRDDQFRVVAVDNHGNRRVSPVRLVSVPIDDTSASLVYTGAWAPAAADPLDFHDTLTSSSTASDSVALLNFTGRYVAWVAPGGGTGVASVVTDGPPTPVTLADFNGRRKIVFEDSFPSVGPHSITITVTSGTVPVDGIIVR